MVDNEKPTDPVVPDEPDPGTPDNPDVPGTPDPDAPGAPTPDERNGLSNQAPFPADTARRHLPRTSDMAVTTIVAAVALLVFCAVGFLVAYRAKRCK